MATLLLLDSMFQWAGAYPPAYYRSLNKEFLKELTDSFVWDLIHLNVFLIPFMFLKDVY